jgi:hypothetical protein
MAMILGLVGLGGVSAFAQDSASPESVEHDLPFQLTGDSVYKEGARVRVGDLRLEEKNATEAVPALDDRSELQKCIQAAPDSLRWSEDGTTIELMVFTSARDTVLTAYCTDRIVLIGGYSQMTPDDSPAGRQFWLFTETPGRQEGRTKSSVTKPLGVGQMPRQTHYRLNELRLIDPKSGRMVFSGTSEDGEWALLSAPFAIKGEK